MTQRDTGLHLGPREIALLNKRPMHVTTVGDQEFRLVKHGHEYIAGRIDRCWPECPAIIEMYHSLSHSVTYTKWRKMVRELTEIMGGPAGVPAT